MGLDRAHAQESRDQYHETGFHYFHLVSSGKEYNWEAETDLQKRERGEAGMTDAIKERSGSKPHSMVRSITAVCSLMSQSGKK